MILDLQVMSTRFLFVLFDALDFLLMVIRQCALDRYRQLWNWISRTVVMLMVMAGMRICYMHCLLFITAMMLMVLLMVVASMLSGTKQADWFFTVLVIMAIMLIGRM